MKDIETRVKQMHFALGKLTDSDFSKVRAVITETPDLVTTEWNFSTQADPIDLANRAYSLISFIASLKDPFKVWLADNGMNRQRAEDFLNQATWAGLIHDLWNLDKHVKANKPYGAKGGPRTRYSPKLVIHGQEMVIGGSGNHSSFSLLVDTHTGDTFPQVTGDVRFKIRADVVDELTGQVICDFQTLCEDATNEWHQELANVGVTL